MSSGVEPIIYDDPNRQCVGLDPAWVEGTGGVEGEPPDSGGVEPAEPSLDSMTKDELLAYGLQHDVDVSSAMTKGEILAAIEEAEA